MTHDSMTKIVFKGFDIKVIDLGVFFFFFFFFAVLPFYEDNFIQLRTE